MSRFLRWAAALLLCAVAGSAFASVEGDALAALDAANAKVSGLSFVSSPSASNIDKVKGELADLGPFFQTVASRLAGVPVDGSTQLLSLGADVNAKIQTAGKTSLVNIGVLIESCRGISADLDAWKALLPQVRAALQQRLDQQTQAIIRDQVAQTFPTLVPAQPAATPTPIVWPTATPLPTLPPMVSQPTPVSLPPVDGGGVIPGGYVPPSNPTPVPAGQPTPVPTPRAQQKLPVPVAAGHNDQAVWVGNVQAGSVGLMDASTRRFLRQVPVGASPVSLALTDNDHTLVVANSGSNSVSLVDADQAVVVKTLSVGAKPVQVLITHQDKAYVACQDGRRVDVIDLKRQLLVKSISLSSRPGHMDLPNSGQHLYVSLPDEDSLAVIDTGMDEVLATAAE